MLVAAGALLSIDLDRFKYVNERNLRVGVTGALMFMGGVFVQLLEGRRDAIEPVFERICRDLRHRRLVLLDFSQVEQRAYPGTGMVAFEGDERRGDGSRRCPRRRRSRAAIGFPPTWPSR